MKRPNIIVLIRNEQEKLQFLKAGIELPDVERLPKARRSASMSQKMIRDSETFCRSSRN
jgi:hypothetical protein